MSDDTNSRRAARPTIFLIEEDDEARPILTNNLRQLGYRLLVVATLEDAYEWVGANGHIHADLVLINLVGKTPEETLRAGRSLRAHAKYDGHTPLVVIPEKVPKELEGKDVNGDGNDWVCYFDDESDQLRALLARLLGKPLI
jgi:CheY-like chemotaxis protein